MAMRNTSARRGASAGAAGTGIEWPAALVATIRHSTLPWYPCRDDELEASTPLSALDKPGERDALSLVGQLAGFLAFARFAGIGNEAFDPAGWGVVQRRGRDVRLIRLASSAVRLVDDTLPIVALESLASLLGAPALDTLRQSWTRPESVYVEIHRRLRATAADRTWFARAATGTIEAPGAECLDRLASSSVVVLTDEPAATATLVRFGALRGGAALDIVTLDGSRGSPLQPMSAVGALLPTRAAHGSESAAAEAAIAALREKHTVIAVAAWDAFDPASKRVVRLLLDSGEPFAWLVPEALAGSAALSGELVTAASTANFIVAGRTRDLAAIHERALRLDAGRASAALEALASDDRAYSALLDDGVVPELSDGAAANRLTEPTRSYLAAIALLGPAPTTSSVECLLEKVGASLPVDALEREEICAVVRGRLVFESEVTRRHLLALLPDGSRASLARIAADAVTVPLRRAALLVAAGVPHEADLAAVAIGDGEFDEVVDVLGEFDATTLSRCPGACALLAEALIRAGRYRDARPYAEAAAPPEGAIALARIERRLGDYAAALAHLDEVADQSFAAALLTGELHRLRGRHDHAVEAFARCEKLASTAREKAALAYERAIHALDRGAPADAVEIASVPHLASRLASYVEETAGNLAGAAAHAREATCTATSVPERIDAELDLVYALFLSGDWNAARHQAREALLVVEETQGDRAAAGVLFTLAFLCADSGQWPQALQKIDRLRRFYTEREDARRAREIDLLTAQLELGRLQLESAERHAVSLLDEPISSEMREAVAVILDDVAWIRGTLVSPRSSGESQCLELTDRHLLAVARTSRTDPHGFRRHFVRELARFEVGRLHGRPVAPPDAASSSDRLLLLRSCIALRTRQLADGLDATIAALSHELEVGELEMAVPTTAARASSRELELIRRATQAELPFTSAALGDARWRFATRNRLGRWAEIGSEETPFDADALDAMVARPPEDWVTVGKGVLLYLEGVSSWSPESRRSLAAIFRDRQELANLRRLAATEREAPVRPGDATVAGIVGNSPAIRAMLALLGPAVSRDVPVCIEGESGTGKELVARAIHERSSRRNRVFTALNCAALPENLVESELFGCVRGAFTGADRDREGLIEATAGGTLFLDEIGEMAPQAQAKLLRFLQEGEFRRVGETTNRMADVRVIAATNRKLEESVDSGIFRDDLYYRIRGIEIAVPPLRERGSDILLLARFFLGRERELHGGGAERLADEVEDLLLSYAWPGNVRELQNAIRAAHALAGDSAVVTIDHLPPRMRDTAVRRPKRGTFNEELNRFRRELIERTLAGSGGNQSRAAKELGLSRQALAYQIRELGILVKRP